MPYKECMLCLPFLVIKDQLIKISLNTMINFCNTNGLRWDKSDKIINVTYFERNAPLYKNTTRWTR